jgi:hypothetical protein
MEGDVPMKFPGLATLSATTLAGLVLVSACTRSDPNLVEQVGADGVREVISVAPEPLPAPWRLVKDLVIGVEYGEDAYMRRAPLDYTVLDDGTQVILDNSPLQIRVYDADGTFVREFGRQGNGPDDLRQYRPSQGSSIRSPDPGLVEVWTGWPTRSQIWRTTGEMVSVKTLAEDHHFLRGRRPRHFRPHGDMIYAQIMTTRPVKQGVMERISHMVATDWEGSRLDSLFVVPHPEMPDNLGVFLEVTGIIPNDHILATSSGRLYVSGFEDDWVREIHPDTGHELLRFRWEHEPDTFADARLEEFRPDIDRTIQEGLDWLNQRVSLMHIVEGPDQEIWVQRIERTPPSGRASILILPGREDIWPTDVFAVDGAYCGRMELPFPARTMKVIGERLYAIARTAEGAPALIRYRVEEAR